MGHPVWNVSYGDDGWRHHYRPPRSRWSDAKRRRESGCSPSGTVGHASDHVSSISISLVIGSYRRAGRSPLCDRVIGESNQADRIALSFGGLSDLQRKNVAATESAWRGAATRAMIRAVTRREGWSPFTRVQTFAKRRAARTAPRARLARLCEELNRTEQWELINAAI